MMKRILVIAMASALHFAIFAGWKAHGLNGSDDAYTQGQGVCQKGHESVTLDGKNVLTKCKSDGSVISGRLQEDGRVVSDNGQEIGHVGEDGNFYEKIGDVVKPSEELVFDSDGKARVLTPDKSGNRCYDTSKSMNQRQIPRGFDAPICAKTMDEAVVQTSPLFGNACENKIEEGLYSKKINGAENNVVKVFNRADMGDGNDKSATLYFDGNEVGAIVHNHPDGSLWPSEADVITALKKNSDVYIDNCNGEYSVFSHTDGRVYKIADGKRVEFDESFPNHVRTNDGHDPYDSKNLEKLRAKAREAKAREEEASLGSTVLVSKMPDLTKLIDLMKQGVEELRKILAAGREPSGAECDAYNKLATKVKEASVAIGEELKRQNFTVAEQEQYGRLLLEKIKPYCDQVESLQKQIEAKGYGRFDMALGF